MERTMNRSFAFPGPLLVILFACGTGLIPAATRGEDETQARKTPNIVFIFSDDHAFQAISAYNDPRG